MKLRINLADFGHELRLGVLTLDVPEYEIHGPLLHDDLVSTLNARSVPVQVIEGIEHAIVERLNVELFMIALKARTTVGPIEY